jgi:transcriptional regulator with XRE-family HTH domain
VSARDLAKLGKFLTDRRAELGITQDEFVSRAGTDAGKPALSVKQLIRIEKGRVSNPQPKTLGALDRGADWEAGSARSVLDGGTPTPRKRSAELEIRDDEERRLVALLMVQNRSIPEIQAHLELRRAHEQERNEITLGRTGDEGKS